MKTFFILTLLFPLTLLGQQNSKVVPDCTLGTIAISSSGASNNYDNRTNGVNVGPPCARWTVDYLAPSTVTGATIAIQGAPDNNGTPGAFANLATSTTLQAASILITGANGYYPWLRVNVTGYMGSGIIRATLNGWRDNASTIASASSSSGCPNPCPVEGTSPTGSAPVGPPVFAGTEDGTNIVPFQTCPNTATVTSTATGETQIIAASMGNKVRICYLDFTPDTSGQIANFRLDYGTGVNCAAGTTQLTGLLSNILAYSNSWSGPQGIPTTPVSQAVCFNQTSNITLHGTVIYAYTAY